MEQGRMTEERADTARMMDFLHSMNYVRESGSSQEKAAADRIAAYVREAGGESATQHFTFTDDRACSQELSYEKGSARMEIPVTWIEGTGSTDGILAAPFLYVEDAGPRSLARVAGRIALVNPAILDSRKYLELQGAGAVAVLTWCGEPLDGEADRRPVRKRLRGLPENTIPGGCIHWRSVQRLLEDTGSFDGAGQRISLMIRHEKREISSQNVVASIRGSVHPDQRILLSAHYDSVPEGPGMYDNLSACALMMEQYRYFLMPEHRPHRTLVFAWFGSEERGLKGSEAFVEQHRAKLGRYLFHFNADLSGQLTGSDVFGVTADETACRVIGQYCEEAGVDAQVRNAVWSSDSNSLAAVGVPAMTYDRDGFYMHTRHDSIDWISETELSRENRLFRFITDKLDKAEPFPIDRHVPDHFLSELASRQPALVVL